ncbi:putative metal-dependent hydrolase [bacterium]|nr:putative metal-dependent hydrolase [bacterium]
MDTPAAPDLRYPIGNFVPDSEANEALRRAHIDALEALPAQLRAAVRGLSESQLDTPYRPGGWSLRQVLHHVPDSHINAYTRFKLALTEERPTIKPYLEERWAELADTRLAPAELSLQLLEALHARLVLLLRSLDSAAFNRPLLHPDSGEHDIDWLLQLYAWHGRHHTAHITALRQRIGW